MRKLLLSASALILVPALASASILGSKTKLESSRTGNVETVTAKEDGKVTYRIVYTYDDSSRKIRGEYWEPAPAKKQDAKKKTNMLAGTAAAKKYEESLSQSKTEDTSGVELDVEKDGFILKNVRIVRYNAQGNPELVMARGYTTYPVVGTFNIKTDYTFSYDQAGRLSAIRELNINVDSVLLNMGIGNTTEITRDASGRPLKVSRTIGSIPPALAATEYEYADKSDSMRKTVFRSCAINMTKLAVEPSETITVTYGKGVPWSGMKKYEFEYGKTIESISIFDEVAKKQRLDLSDFRKLRIIEKGKKMKLFYDLYKNEQQGPRWRMGELPDVPEPFMVYKDYAWWN